MKDLICIVCPNGCRMQAQLKEGRIEVRGNKCRRGEQFAFAELTRPMRTVCTIVNTADPEIPVIPVRVNGEIPKDMIVPVMREIKKVTVEEPVRRGDVLLPNVLNLGVDVIATSSVLWEKDCRAEDETEVIAGRWESV